MPEVLEEMLRRAQAAEQAEGQTQQGAEVQDKQQGGADLEASLKERESLLGETERTRQEKVKAETLRAQAEEATRGKGRITAEMQGFLRAAANTVEERTAHIVELKRSIASIEANPAIINELHEQANEENRRIELQKEVSKTSWVHREDGKEGTIHSVLGDNKDYKDKIAGRHVGDSSLVQLEGYAMRASGMMKGEEAEVPLEEAEDVVSRLSQIRQEAEKTNPDTRKIDGLLSEFLSKRLQHFAATFDQRVEKRAQGLRERYQKNPDRTNKNGVNSWTVDQWKADLYRFLPDVGRVLQLTEMTMQGKDYKALALARIGEDVSNRTRVLGKESNPFLTDNFKEPEKQK